MDKAFRDAMTAGYTLTEPGVVLGSAMHDGELVQRRPRPGRRCRCSTATGSSRAPPEPARPRPSS